MKKQLLIILSLLSWGIFAQELSCKVTINTQRVNQTNQRVFATLQRSLQEFINRNRPQDKGERTYRLFFRLYCLFL